MSTHAFKTICSFALLLFMAGCHKDDSSTPTSVKSGNDPNFKIEANKEGVLTTFSKKVEVFGIKIFAASKVEDKKLLHAANVMAQYLDNDEDGKVDNSKVLEEMKKRNASIVLWKEESDLDLTPPKNWELQDLGNDETHPDFVTKGKKGTFDASLEEILHLITHVGYANAYPEVFGEKAGSKIAMAMDNARGGFFDKIPGSYPAVAWYTYDDKTCDYSCQVTEYFYWALTSILGAQENRSSEIGNEWKLNTKEKVGNKDLKVFELLTDAKYKLPTILPDGSYKH
ncbi:MAG: hypothetical protein ACEPOZ_03645 [Marinifilaceae bacterium]